MSNPIAETPASAFPMGAALAMLPPAAGGAIQQTLAPGEAIAPGAGDSGNLELLRRAKVMMVDDEPITIEVMREFLEEAGYANFVDTSNPEEAMQLVADERPDVILLDLMMPVVSGFDILAALRADENYRHIPVIVLTSSTDSRTKLRALELGATDFLAKPVDSSELALRLRNTLAAKAYQDRLTYFDVLTGLPNRRMFCDHLDWTLRQAQRYERIGALLYINIDHFKKINDALGPAIADTFLQAISKRLEQSVRASDTIAHAGEESLHPRLSRVGGDEFAVLLVEMEKEEDAIRVANRMLDVMGMPFQVAGRELFTTCSIGISVFPADGIDRDGLLQNAGVAMRFAKQQGGNAYRFYSSDLNERSLQYLGLESDLRKAVERNELQLYYQPKINAASKTIAGAEVLIRWKHIERGFIKPDDFIPLAEETGLIVPIGAWIFAEACRSIKKWQAQGLSVPRVSVNVSGRQFSTPGFHQTVSDIIDSTGIDPQCITFEVTESMLMENAQENILLLNQLKAMGLQLSMDDFGTGYSSLSYLRRFPLDELKIDRSFLAELDVGNKGDGGMLIVAIIALGHSLGLRIVAEGVETEAQYEFLRRHECDECQGYFFSKPIPGVEFEALLAKQLE
ncbi:MAG: Bacteriophytochrome cph2 [Herminiimonas sp.]|nr:Bacteriophytochrome cph2 [Herminiimonas sp.]